MEVVVSAPLCPLYAAASAGAERSDELAEAISQPVSSTCYRTNCTLTLTAKGGKLTAHASTTTPLPAPVTDPNLKLSVDLEADIASNTFGGTGIQHTGSCGESTTMLHYMKVEWE